MSGGVDVYFRTSFPNYNVLPVHLNLHCRHVRLGKPVAVTAFACTHNPEEAVAGNCWRKHNNNWITLLRGDNVCNALFFNRKGLNIYYTLNYIFHLSFGCDAYTSREVLAAEVNVTFSESNNSTAVPCYNENIYCR